MDRTRARRDAAMARGEGEGEGWSFSSLPSSSSSATSSSTPAANPLLLLSTPERARQRHSCRRSPRRRPAPPLLLLLSALAAAAVATAPLLQLAAAARPAPTTGGGGGAGRAPSSPAASTKLVAPAQKEGYGSPACAKLDRKLDAQDLASAAAAPKRCDARCRAETADALSRLYDMWQGENWGVGPARDRAAEAMYAAEEEAAADGEGDGDYEGAEAALGAAERLRLTNDRYWDPERDPCAPEDDEDAPPSCHVSPSRALAPGETEAPSAAAAAAALAAAPFTRAQYESAALQPEYCCWSGVVCCLDYGSADTAARLAGGGAGSLLPGGNATAACAPYAVQALVMRGFGANGSLADAMDGPASPLRVLYRHGLRTLRLSSNDLRGSIPESLAEMPQLRTLDLADNWLEGELPAALGAVEGLIDIALDFNGLTGPLSSAAFCDPKRTGRSRASLSTLQALTARANALTGGINLRACGGLKLVDLRDNRLTGTLPFGVENQGLATMRLGNNQFSGAIPEDVWFVQFLNVLDLNNNSMSGSISPAVADAGHLNTIYLGRNELRGEIPPELFLAPQLSLLELQYNPGLNGTLPRDMTSAVGLTRLWLHGTSVSGPIPSSMAELPFLTDVNIRSTEMSCCRSWDEAVRANATTQARIDAEARGERPERGRPGEPELLPYFLTFAGDTIAAPGSRLFVATPGAPAKDGTYPGGGVGAAGVRAAVESLAGPGQQQPQKRLGLQVFPPQPPPLPLPPPLASRGATALSASGGGGGGGGRRRRRSLLAAGTGVKGNFVSDPSGVQVDLVLGQDTVCPAVRRSPAFASSSAASGSNARVLTPADLTAQAWQIDPAYYWDMRCRCQAGLRPSRQTFQYTIDRMGTPVRYDRLTCVPQTSNDRDVALAVGLSVGLAGAVLCACLFAWCMCFRRVSRTQRAIAAASKRLKGCPRSGTATFVVTDIEGYSDLMKSCPEAMLRALSLHNAILRRAKYSNVGYTLEQEGDSFALLFHTPYDAASFCLQAQQALMRVDWPRSLTAALDERMAEETEAALAAAGVAVVVAQAAEEHEGGGGAGVAHHHQQQQANTANTSTTTAAPSSDDQVSSKPTTAAAKRGGGSSSEWLGEPLSPLPPAGGGGGDDSGDGRARRRPSQLWARNQPRLDEDGGGRAGAAATRGRSRGRGRARKDDDDDDDNSSGGGGKGGGGNNNNSHSPDDGVTERSANSASTYGAGGMPRDLSPAPSGGGRGGGKPRWLGGGGGGGAAPRAGSTLFSRFASSPSVAWLGGGGGAGRGGGGGGGAHDRLGGGASRALSGGEDGAGGLDRKGSGAGAPLPLHLHPHAAQANVASPLLSAVTGPFKGLRVRMGVATGQLPGQGQDPRAAAVFQMAKAVCDAASGGQVLMDARTFQGIKEDLHALGATDAGGLNYRRLASKRSVRDALCCAPPQESDEAIVLDMGAYVVRPWASRLEEQPHRGKPPASGGSAPLAAVAEGKPQQQHPSASAGLVLPGRSGGGGGAAAAAAASTAAAADALCSNQLLPGAMDAHDPAEQDGGGALGGLGGLVARQASLTALGAWARPNFAQLRGAGGGGGGAGGAGGGGAWATEDAAAGGGGGGAASTAATTAAATAAYPVSGGDPIIGALASQQRLRAEDIVRLVQIIAPPLVGRAKVFGNALALPAGWVCVDPPYFSAPAAGELPLVPEGRREADASAIAALDVRAAGSSGAAPSGSGGGQQGGAGGNGSGGVVIGGGGSGNDSSGHPRRTSLSVIISSGGGGAAGHNPSIPGVVSPAPAAAGGSHHGGNNNYNSSQLTPALSGGTRGGNLSFFGGPVGTGAGGALGPRSSLWRSVALGPSGGVFAAVSGAGGARLSAATAVVRAQQAAAAGALLSPSLLPLSAPAPPITMVFVCVEGAKALSKRRRAYAREMHALILGLATAALAHVAPPAPPLPYAANTGAGVAADAEDDAHDDDDEAAARDEAAAAAPRGAGYLCREQEGELKYMVAFSTPRAALEWCMALQEAAMYLRWPRWVLQSKGFHAHHGPAMGGAAAAMAAAAQAQAAAAVAHPGQQQNVGAAAVAAAARLAAEAAASGSGPLPRLGPAADYRARSSTPTPPSPLPFGAGGGPGAGTGAGGARTLLFRGPRLKMGVCEGVPSTVLPDHLGRADYHGSSINQAARYMDAGAHGGQVVCEADLARRVFEEWRREARALGALAAARAAAAAAGAAAGEGVEGLLQVGGGRRRRAGGESDTDTDAFQEADEESLAGRQQQPQEDDDGSGEASSARGRPAAGPRSHSLRGSPSPQRGASRLSNMQRGGDGADGARGGGGGGGGAATKAEAASASAVASAAAAAAAPTAAPPPTATAPTAAGPASPPLVAARPDPPGPRLAPPAGAARRPVRVEAHWAGRYRFKGNPAPVDLVCVSSALLVGRLALLPPEPPKGKGVRLQARCGLAFAADGAMLPALPQMYRARVPQSVLDPPAGLRRGGGGAGGGYGSGSSVSSLGGGGGFGGPVPPAAVLMGAGGAGGAFSAAPGTVAPSGSIAPSAAGGYQHQHHQQHPAMRAASMPSSSLPSGSAAARSRSRAAGGVGMVPSFLVPGRSSGRDASMTLSETAWVQPPDEGAGGSPRQ